jgi:hypothetical protein
MGLSRREFVALGRLNEVAEFVIRKTRPDLLWGSPESFGNVVGDLVANRIGYELGGWPLSPR